MEWRVVCMHFFRRLNCFSRATSASVAPAGEAPASVAGGVAARAAIQTQDRVRGNKVAGFGVVAPPPVVTLYTMDGACVKQELKESMTVEQLISARSAEMPQQLRTRIINRRFSELRKGDYLLYKGGEEDPLSNESILSDGEVLFLLPNPDSSLTLDHLEGGQCSKFGNLLCYAICYAKPKITSLLLESGARDGERVFTLRKQTMV